MPTSHLARAPRQAAVLATIAGLHAAVFGLIVAGLGPRLLIPTFDKPVEGVGLGADPLTGTSGRGPDLP